MNSRQSVVQAIHLDDSHDSKPKPAVPISSYLLVPILYIRPIIYLLVCCTLPVIVSKLTPPLSSGCDPSATF